LTLSGYQLAVLLRLTRAGMREVLSEEYIKTAWAKGLSPFKVILKHALRNVLIPVVTIAGLSFGELIAFSIVTETIFQWPGMGNLLLTSIFETDQPVIVTYIMLAAVHHFDHQYPGGFAVRVPQPQDLDTSRRLWPVCSNPSTSQTICGTRPP
jgi:ABC-type dipeptide/oligopeptide/nickel transport system permease component